MRAIYLDYNATTPIAPSVQEAMLPFLSEHYGNPSSSHALGRACHEAIEDARDRVAAVLGTHRDEIVFTSGGTESNNLALKGILMSHAPQVGGHLGISAIEHPWLLRSTPHPAYAGRVHCDAVGHCRTENSRSTPQRDSLHELLESATTFTA